MKAYFQKVLQNTMTNGISPLEIEKYRTALTSEIIRQGGDSSDIGLISKNLIINSIKNKRTVEDTAWAILQ